MNNHLLIFTLSFSLFLSLSIILMAFRRCISPCFGRPNQIDDVEDIESIPTKTTDEPSSSPRKYTWAEVEMLTKNFTAEVVGEGGFSTVYLGRASSDKKAVAVKVQRSSERLRRAFLQELDVLLNLRHPNIVRLVGYCDDCEEGVLIFDYVPNGTLFQNLRSARPLTWRQRMRAAYGIASAVAHLHESGSGAVQIVHGDLTSSNVLLDETLKPYLCDLGSALVGFSGAVGPARCLLLGSPGYADPVLLRTGVVSKKTDVYSFGVLLLELITGKAAFAEEEEEGRSALLTAEVGEVVRGGDEERVRGILDIRVGEEFDLEELMVVAAAAGRCIEGRTALRPSMEEILGILREKISGVLD